MLALVPWLALLESSQKALDSTVSITVRAESADRFADELSNRTGIRFACSVLTKDEILFVKVTDVPLRDLMKRVSQATHAGWVQEGAGFRLDRPVEIKQAEEADALLKRTKLCAEAIETRKRQIAALPDFDDKAAKALGNDYAEAVGAHTAGQTGHGGRSLGGLVERGPGSRLFARILAHLDPAFLARLPYSRRIVLSRHPTAMQRPLPSTINEDINQFVAEQNAWATAGAPLFAATNGNLMLVGLDTNPVPSSDLQLLLFCHRTGQVELPYFDMKVADAKGHVLTRGWGMLPATDTPQFSPRSDLDDQPVTMSWGPEALAMRKAAADPKEDLPAEIAESLTRPEERDPLSFAVSDVLLSSAHENEVIDLTDGLFELAASPEFKPTKWRQVKNFLFQGGVAVEEDGGWVVGSPMDPIQVRRARLARGPLGEMLRAAWREGRASLDIRATFAARTDPDSIDEFSPSLLTWMHLPGGQDDADALRVYAGLSAGQRAAARSQPITISAATLSLPQYEAFSRRVYQRDNLLAAGPFMAGSPASMPTELSFEPTIAYPNGIPRDCQLVLGGREQSVAAPASGQTDPLHPWLYEPSTAENVAWSLFMTERPDAGGPASIPRLKSSDFSDVSFGTSTSWQFSLNFPAGFISAFTLRDHALGRPMPFARLPMAFRKAIDEYLAKFRATWKSIPIDSGQKSEPPP